MKALVTGGAGFIGSHLVDALVADGHEVHVVDDLSTGRLANLEPALEQGAELHTEDVTDAAWMTDLAAIIRPEVVFHLAAHLDVRRSVDDPAFDAAVNVTGTAAVLDAARRAGARMLVLASTAAVYGRAGELPARETSPVAPLSPYGASKAAAESYLALYTRLHGLPTLALRMANVYGPRQDPDGEAGVVAIFAAAAAAGSPAVVFGDGLQTRDYVYVDDAVDRLPRRGAELRRRRAERLDRARDAGARDRRAARRRRRVRTARHGELVRSCLDPSAARRALGWQARTTLADGLAASAERCRRVTLQLTV